MANALGGLLPPFWLSSGDSRSCASGSRVFPQTPAPTGAKVRCVARDGGGRGRGRSGGARPQRKSGWGSQDVEERDYSNQRGWGDQEVGVNPQDQSDPALVPARRTAAFKPNAGRRVPRRGFPRADEDARSGSRSGFVPESAGRRRRDVDESVMPGLRRGWGAAGEEEPADFAWLQDSEASDARRDEADDAWAEDWTGPRWGGRDQPTEDWARVAEGEWDVGPTVRWRKGKGRREEGNSGPGGRGMWARGPGRRQKGAEPDSGAQWRSSQWRGAAQRYGWTREEERGGTAGGLHGVKGYRAKDPEWRRDTSSGEEDFSDEAEAWGVAEGGALSRAPYSWASRSSEQSRGASTGRPQGGARDWEGSGQRSQWKDKEPADWGDAAPAGGVAYPAWEGSLHSRRVQPRRSSGGRPGAIGRMGAREERLDKRGGGAGVAWKTEHQDTGNRELALNSAWEGPWDVEEQGVGGRSAEIADEATLLSDDAAAGYDEAPNESTDLGVLARNTARVRITQKVEAARERPGQGSRGEAADKEGEAVPTQRPRAAQTGPGCYACGATMQYQHPQFPGYIPEGTYLLKRKHRQLASLACARCQELAQGKLIAAVGGHGGYRIQVPEDMPMLTAEDLRQQLKPLRTQKALILKLVDVLDFNGSFLTRIRDIVGANPIALVVTKIDLLPEGTNLDALGDWMLEVVRRKKLNVVAVHLTSSKAKHGFAAVAATIHRERQGRDVYVVGAANVGKSAFVSALLDEMAERDAMASAARRRKPIASAVPGTTLGPICLKAFSNGGDLWDTPGVHLHHRMAAFLAPPDLKTLGFTRRLRGYTVAPDNGGGLTLFWGGLLRVDILKAPKGTSLTFFGPTAIKVSKVSTQEASQYYQDELGQALSPPSSQCCSPDDWEGLPALHSIRLDVDAGAQATGPVADLAVSGLGWIQISVAPTALPGDWDAEEWADGEDERVRSDPNDSTEDWGDEGHTSSEWAPNELAIELAVHAPKGVEVFARPAMPVGLSAGQWYEYADLSEAQEQARPPLVYEGRSIG